MAFKLPSRVKETSITVGTGSYALSGAVTGYRTFASALTAADTFFYHAEAGAEYEYGLGTLTGGALARTTIYGSSNAGAAVSWSAGTKTVAISLPGITDLPVAGIMLLRYAIGNGVKGVAIASATTITVGADGDFCHVTGTTTITDIDFSPAADGSVQTIIFDGSLVLTHNATTLILPGGANIITQAGDRAVFVQDAGDNVICVDYVRASGIREKLSANRTYYVRTDGSDSNTGLANSAAGAFLTIQKAINVCATLDLGGFAVTIQVGAGTFAGFSVTSPFIGGAVTVLGDTTTPTNCVINSQVWCDGSGSIIYIGGFSLSHSGNRLLATLEGQIRVNGNMTYATAGGYHMTANDGGKIIVTANYSIVAGAACHMLTGGYGGVIDISGRTVTITGTPAFSTAFAYCNTGMINANSVTFSGAATGTRYTVAYLGFMNTGGGGVNYFPGNVAGGGTNPGASPYGMYL